MAVIASIEGKGYVQAYDLPARAVGTALDCHGSTINTAQFRAATKRSWGESLFYPEFLDDLLAIAAHNCANYEQLSREMRYQQRSGSAFEPILEGQAELKPGRAPEQALEQIFKTDVSKVPTGRIDAFPDRMAELLQMSEVLYDRDLVQDVCIDLDAGEAQSPMVLRFDYALVREHRLPSACGWGAHGP